MNSIEAHLPVAGPMPQGKNMTKQLYPWGWVLKIGLLKLVAGSIRGSDDGRATFAESNTNFTEGIFHMITSEFPGSSWGILSYKKK